MLHKVKIEKDQLKIHQKAGRIFKGWEEGKICFAPTYKYITNSDNYIAQSSTPKEKRRTVLENVLKGFSISHRHNAKEKFFLI
ncbi:DNAse I-like superfamily protein [Artemisia annua]|uniref:DNAse I-like superfamily protein n=1 Tax=Artemisia annua TaxID=35608 RepID=A0A2U1LPI7_ARTAN|nr:DNAse I-like superfamily protein [Artemisia annua]